MKFGSSLRRFVKYGWVTWSWTEWQPYFTYGCKWISDSLFRISWPICMNFYIVHSMHYDTYIKTLETPTKAQLYSLYILSINQLLNVSALSPSSGSLHQNIIKTYNST